MHACVHGLLAGKSNMLMDDDDDAVREPGGSGKGGLPLTPAQQKKQEKKKDNEAEMRKQLVASAVAELVRTGYFGCAGRLLRSLEAFPCSFVRGLSTAQTEPLLLCDLAETMTLQRKGCRSGSSFTS